MRWWFLCIDLLFQGIYDGIDLSQRLQLLLVAVQDVGKGLEVSGVQLATNLLNDTHHVPTWQTWHKLLSTFGVGLREISNGRISQSYVRITTLGKGGRAVVVVKVLI